MFFSNEFIAKRLSRRTCSPATILLAVFLFVSSSAAQIPTPKDVLGFNPTDDRTIADWKQITTYFGKLDDASKRVKVEEIGRTTLGKPQIAAFISSEENIDNLGHIKWANSEIAQGRIPLGRRDGALSAIEPKAIVAISCSIHSTEIVASQMSMILAYELAYKNDPATKEILENTVLILIPSANPDGIDIVADWYRKTLGTKYEGTSPPELYHHYAGHDNNRDWFMMNLAETRNITKLFWQQWFPQIVYDVHQQGSTGSRMTIPPCFYPPNPRIPAMLLREIGFVGYKMAADLARTGETGVATNATYDTWWHGGFRSAPYYHNSVGILSEAASASLMTPIEVTREQLSTQNPTRGLKSPMQTSTSFPAVWEGGTWGPRDIARIELTAARSLLELAAKFRIRFIENSRKLAAANLGRSKDEPVAFVVPAGQPYGERVSRLLEVLMWQGIEVDALSKEIHVSTARSENPKFDEIPAGSFVIRVNQPQKNNVLSLFEEQVYPNRVDESGEAEVPYDVAGWTLPLQMGVEYFEVWEIEHPETASSSMRKIERINQARELLSLRPSAGSFANMPNPLKSDPRIGLYKGFGGNMDEGWTRLVFDINSIPYKSIGNSEIVDGNLDFDAVVFPSQSEKAILNGLSDRTYPAEFAGGIGDKGLANLKNFVSGGGKLICFDDSCEMVINSFELPMKNSLKGLNRKQFHCPGSILQIDVDTLHPVARGMKPRTAAYFIYSSAFEINDASRVKEIAKYDEEDILMSGWIYGENHITGKTAIAEAAYGKGKIVLFGFRPQHRGQTFGTFPFVFNALDKY